MFDKRDGGIFVGTAGWNVSAAYAATFPPGGSHLARYGARMGAVEINSSFTRPHKPSTYARWAASVPPAFRFAVKVPRTITHEHRLTACDDLLARFLDEAGALEERLGPVLVQLPPSLAFVAPVAAAFLHGLRLRFAGAVVVEPRHASWFGPEASRCLLDHRVARVAADPAPVRAAAEPGGWPGLVYLRLHGAPRIYHSPYGAGALAATADRLREAAGRGVPAWCIFDNTALGHALGDALAVMRDLEGGGA